VTIKLKIPKRKTSASKNTGPVSRDPVIRIALAAFIVLSLGICGWFTYYYVKYDRVI